MNSEKSLFAQMHKMFPKARVFMVGGALRDEIRRQKAKDRDFVVTNVAQKTLLAWLQKHGKADIAGERFGVIKFTGRGEKEIIDIAVPRTEHPTAGGAGRYRDVEVQTNPSLPIEKDLARRDFTINAMARDVITGELIDPFGGKANLNKKIIRAVGDAKKRFAEDHTRVLRAVRFACELGFSIEPKTMRAMRQVAKKIPKTVTAQMIAYELTRALLADATKAVFLLRACGVLDALLPELRSRTSSYFPQIKKALPLVCVVALLLRGVQARKLHNVIARLALNTMPHDTPLRLETKQLMGLCAIINDTRNPARLRAHEFERLYLNKDKEKVTSCLIALGQKTRLASIKKRTCSLRFGKPLVTGDDVVALGITGIRVRDVLNSVRDKQLEGKIRTRGQALSLLSKP